MKFFTKTFVTLGLVVSTLDATADGPYSFSGNFGMVSEYVFRGITQTDEELAIQGGIDFAHESGFYLGTWGSNVEFFDSTQAELDFYGGFSGETVNGLNWDIGAIYYSYPGEPAGANYEFVEFYSGLSYGFGGDLQPTIGVSVNYSPDYFAASGDAFYWLSSVDLALPAGFGLSLGYGYQAIDDNAAFGTPDYSDWSVGLSKSVGGLDFSATYFDTDLNGFDCFGGPDSACDSRFVISMGISM